MTQDLPKRRFPISLGIAAGYLIVAGVISLAWLLIAPDAPNPEFEAKSQAFQLGAYLKCVMINIFFIVSGVGLFFRKSWARKLGLLILCVATVYASSEFAWGFAQGKPGLAVWIGSIGIFGVWNAIWFILIFKRSSREATLTRQSPSAESEPDMPPAK